MHAKVCVHGFMIQLHIQLTFALFALLFIWVYAMAQVWFLLGAQLLHCAACAVATAINFAWVFFFTYKLALEYFQTFACRLTTKQQKVCQAARRCLERDWLRGEKREARICGRKKEKKEARICGRKKKAQALLRGEKREARICGRGGEGRGAVIGGAGKKEKEVFFKS